MGVVERKKLYKEIEVTTKRPLLVYATSQRPGIPAQIAADVIDQFIVQIEALPAKTAGIDLFVESFGGDPLVIWRIVSLIRNKVKDFNVIIPHSAYSAATLLAMGANKIIMGKYGCLGPIDPQITVGKKDGTTQQFAYEDVIAYLEFTKKEGGLTEQSHREVAFKMLCEAVEPATLGFAKRSSALSTTMAEKLLLEHMTSVEEKAQAKDIALKLNKDFFNHGHSLSCKEASEIGLKIEMADDKIDKLLWSIHKDLESEFLNLVPFNPITEFLKTEGTDIYTQSPPPLTLPAQINQQTAMQMLNEYVQSQLRAVIPKVEQELTLAALESTRIASQCFSKIRIMVVRTPDLRLIANVVPVDGGWKNIS